MTRKMTVLTLCAIVLTLCSSAEAQRTAGRIPRIGFLSRDLHPSDSRAAETSGLEFLKVCGSGLHRGEKQYHRVQVCRRKT